MYEKINKPIEIGGLQLKNPIIFAPTTFGLKREDYYKKIEEIAAGGCSMIIIGDVPVTKSLFGSLYNKKGFAHYKKLADIVHAHDCKICAQLHLSDSNMKAMIKYIPGVLTKKISGEDLRALLNNEVSNYITNIPEQKVRSITDTFGTAAILAQKAGFDMVQVHGDRICGSFSSSLFNKRKDRYGGSLENRGRFAREAITSIRKKLPSIPIDYKLVIREEDPHYGNAGILEEELPYFVQMLEEAGVNSFHVTLANHGNLTDTIPPANHPYFKGEGCFLKYCKEVKKYTHLPICGVGGLSTPDFIESKLEEGLIDCAAMSRQLIADPNWVNKVLSGEEKKIKHCIRCNKACLGGIKEHKGVHCIYDKEAN